MSPQSDDSLLAATNPADPAENGLARAAKSGDPRAFEDLVRLHSSRVYNYIYQMTRHRQDAEDLAQQTFLKAFQALARLDPDRPFIAWLLTIARRTALNHFRGAKSWVEFPIDAVSREVSPDRDTERQDAIENLWDRARAALSPRDFEVLWLRISEDLEMKDIAQATGLTETHVKVIIHRARQQLINSMPL